MNNTTQKNEQQELPPLPQSLLIAIGEYGLARTDGVGELEVQHRWETLIRGIKQYAAALSRPSVIRAQAMEGELPPLPFAILPEEMKALKRFHDCVSDGEGYDVPKEMMKRLARIGVIRRVTANYYEHTEFGLSILDGGFAEDASAIRSLASQPAQDGWVLMPTRLTAENGAKAALSGEFAEIYHLDCPDCADVGEVSDDCETCNGEGEVPVHLPIEWTTIKAIYAKAVETCALAAAPQPSTEAAQPDSDIVCHNHPDTHRDLVVTDKEYTCFDCGDSWPIRPNSSEASSDKAVVTDERIERAMQMAQEFASSWALVGGRFDNGGEIENAESLKADLRTYLSALLQSAAPAQTVAKEVGIASIKMLKARAELAVRTGAFPIIEAGLAPAIVALCDAYLSVSAQEQEKNP